MRTAAWLVSALTFAGAVYGCSDKLRVPGFMTTTATGAGSGSGNGGAGGDSLLATGAGGGCDLEACGTEVHAIEFNAPNIYFVIDASGSMSEPVPNKNKTRYTVVRNAAIDLVTTLGPLINVGAAIFPNKSGNCSAGDEVLAVRKGDPPGTPYTGSTLQLFKDATNRTPDGGTPTSASLEALVPKLAKLPGRTIVLLLTDGGPNCNPNITCSADQCQMNIEKQCPVANCCIKGYPAGGPSLCVDHDASVQAVLDVHGLGVDVYVIGVANLDVYEQVMDDMAVAGGVPATTGTTKYVAAQDLDTLGPTLGKIASDAISCEIKLAKAPEMQGFTNVYFGCTVVPFSAADGWSWTGTDTVTLHGTACAQLKAGKVSKVQVVTGCPTEMPK